MICSFLPHQSLKEFVKKYDVYSRFGYSYAVLPMHIQELELQELFLIKEGRIALGFNSHTPSSSPSPPPLSPDFFKAPPLSMLGP